MNPKITIEFSDSGVSCHSTIGRKTDFEFFPIKNSKPRRLLDYVGKTLIRVWQIMDKNTISESDKQERA